MTKKAARRLSVLMPHFETDNVTFVNRMESENTSGKVTPPKSVDNNVYASIDGKLNSYARIHGPVSSAKPQWISFPTVQKENLQEVIYQKTAGEGIAKVCEGPGEGKGGGGGWRSCNQQDKRRGCNGLF